MKDFKSDDRSPKSGNQGGWSYKPLQSRNDSGLTLTYYRKHRRRRAERVLQEHYRKLLKSGKLLALCELESQN